MYFQASKVSAAVGGQDMFGNVPAETQCCHETYTKTGVGGMLQGGVDMPMVGMRLGSAI